MSWWSYFWVACRAAAKKFFRIVLTIWYRTLYLASRTYKFVWSCTSTELIIEKVCHQSLCRSTPTLDRTLYIFFFRKLQENTYFPEYSGMSLILRRSAPGSLKLVRGVKREKWEWNRISAHESIFWVSIDALQKTFHR